MSEITDWKHVDDELPPCDGEYIIRGYGVVSKVRGDWLADYDGRVFKKAGQHYCASEWKYNLPPEKRYGKVKK